jgi:hypothetical protein
MLRRLRAGRHRHAVAVGSDHERVGADELERDLVRAVERERAGQRGGAEAGDVERRVLVAAATVGTREPRIGADVDAEDLDVDRRLEREVARIRDQRAVDLQRATFTAAQYQLVGLDDLLLRRIGFRAEDARDVLEEHLAVDPLSVGRDATADDMTPATLGGNRRTTPGTVRHARVSGTRERQHQHVARERGHRRALELFVGRTLERRGGRVGTAGGEEERRESELGDVCFHGCQRECSARTTSPRASNPRIGANRERFFTHTRTR